MNKTTPLLQLRLSLLLPLLLLLLPFASNGQDKLEVSIGYQRQQYNALELGINITERSGLDKSRNVHFCGEYLYGSSKPDMFGVKTGFSLVSKVFIISGQAAYHFNKDEEVLLVRPEVGLSLFGFMDLTYGYNLFLHNTNPHMQHSVVSIRVNIPLALYL